MSLSILTFLHLAVSEDDSLKDDNHSNCTLLHANETILQIKGLLIKIKGFIYLDKRLQDLTPFGRVIKEKSNLSDFM